MAHFPIEGLAGSTPVNQVDTSPRHPLGFEMDMIDAVLGSGKFIYMKGVASTVVGSVVTWDAGEASPTYQTALNAATANAGQQLAVAMAAILAGQYGWYCVQGTVPVATNGTLAGAGVVYAVSGGQITSASTAGKAVNNMRAKTATGTPVAGQAYCQLAYPFGEGVVA